MKAGYILLVASTLFYGCRILKNSSDLNKPSKESRLSQEVTTLGDRKNAPSYGYTPLDPLPATIDSVFIIHDSTKKRTFIRVSDIINIHGNSELGDLFSDETIRMAVGTIDAKANVSFGTTAIGTENNSYIVVLDYIKYTSIPMKGLVISDTAGHKRIKSVSLNYASFYTSDSLSAFNTLLPHEKVEETIIPLYVGIGLRITANLKVTKGSINLGNLFGIGLNASGGQAVGTLVVQTLGITGDQISPLIPMPSDLNSTTIQNAILSLGSIKAKMYEPTTILSPRVVAFYNNIGGNGNDITNSVISHVFSQKIAISGKTPLSIDVPSN